MHYKNWYVTTFFVMIMTLFVFLPTVTAQDSSIQASFSQTVQNIVIDILSIAVPIIVTTLLGYAVQFVRKQVDLIRMRLSAEHLYLMDSIVAIAVKNAEQAGLLGEISKAGKAKKMYAIEFVQTALRRRGLGLLADNVDEIAALIEAAVNDGLNKPYNPEESALSVAQIAHR